MVICTNDCTELKGNFRFHRPDQAPRSEHILKDSLASDAVPEYSSGRQDAPVSPYKHSAIAAGRWRPPLADTMLKKGLCLVARPLTHDGEVGCSNSSSST